MEDSTHTDKEKKLLQLELEGLYQAAELLTKRINHIRNEKATETDPSRSLKYDMDIERLEAERAALTKKTNDINRILNDESYAIIKMLLYLDFVEQDEELSKHKGKKSYYVFLQGTPHCGLHYFVLRNHRDVAIKIIKADEVVLGHSEKNLAIWQQIVSMLDLDQGNDPIIIQELEDISRDIPATIATRVESLLHEKPIVILLYNIETWGKVYLSKLKTLLKHLDQIKIRKNIKYSLHWYFVHTGAPELIADDDLIVLPPVEKIAETEVKRIFHMSSTHNNYFRAPPESIRPLFQSPKNLSDIIDIFLEHSSCGDQLRQYFNKLQLT